MAAALPLLLLLAGAVPSDETVVEHRHEWRADHPVAVGARLSSWFGGYFAPSAGGLIKLRPWRLLGVDLFSDNFLRIQDGAWRHDHVIGFSAYAPALLAWTEGYLAPSLGACVDFRFAHPSGDSPSTSDVLFGAHAGLIAEFFIDYGFSFQVSASATGYLGHESSVARWSATLSNALHLTPIGLLTGGVNYSF